MRTRILTAMTVATVLIASSAASAQVGNAPFSPGAATPGAGMTFGYRQAIVNAKILGQRPRALVRGPSGELLSIRRSGRNALVQNAQDGSYIPGARPNASWPTGLGTGLGWNLVSYGSSGGSGIMPSQSLNTWISMVPAGEYGETSSIGLYSDGGGSPINTWIIQLNMI